MEILTKIFNFIDQPFILTLIALFLFVAIVRTYFSLGIPSSGMVAIINEHNLDKIQIEYNGKIYTEENGLIGYAITWTRNVFLIKVEDEFGVEYIEGYEDEFELDKLKK